MESVNKISLKIQEGQKNFVEQASFSEQEKNISEVFKLCPELENIALESVGIDESLANKTVRLYRIENRNKKVEKSKEGGNNDKYIGQWFTTDISYAIDYIENTYNKNESGVNYDDTVLHYTELPIKEASKYLVSKETIANEKLEAEPDSFHIEDRSNLQTLELADLLHAFKKGGIIRTKFGFDKKHIEPLILEKISGLAPIDASFDDVVAFSEKRRDGIEKYQEYLETVFPDSKAKDVLWHGTISGENFNNFDINKESSFGFKKHGAIFFTTSIEDAKTRGSGDVNKRATKIIPSLVDIKNPLVSGSKNIEDEYDDVISEDPKEIENFLNSQEIQQKWREKNWQSRIEDGKLILKKVHKYDDLGLQSEDGSYFYSLSHNAGFIGDINEEQTNEWKALGYDGVIDDTHIAKLSGLGGDKKWIAVFDSNQIHILGSENDIEKFKEFTLKSSEQINLETSPMREAYQLLGADSPLNLSLLYTQEDQKLMKSGAWDYNNEHLVVNKVKNILENTDVSQLSDKEKEWRTEILWFWYHHAISCAIWRYKDKDKAKMYSAKALELQDAGHPNQITKLLELLVNSKLEEAEAWADQISEEVEKETALSFIKEFKNGGFF